MGSCEEICFFWCVTICKAWDDCFLEGNDGCRAKNTTREYIFSPIPFLYHHCMQIVESTRKQFFFFFLDKGGAGPTVPWWAYVRSAEITWSHLCWETCHGHHAWDERGTKATQGNSVVFFPPNLHQLPWPCTGAVCYSQAKRIQLIFSCLFIYETTDIMVKERQVLVMRAVFR